MRILFVTWDGPQVSYLESLFLPIFAGLRAEGVVVDVLQFGWGGEGWEQRSRRAAAAAGVGYRAVSTWRWGGGAGPFLSARLGGRHVRKAVADFGSDIIMPRSLMPAIAVSAAGGSRLRPVVFDADGLEADERVDVGGLTPQSASYRILRDVEAQMVRQASAVLTRTDLAAEVLHHRAGPPVRRDRFHLVVNGRDEHVFHPATEAARAAVRAELGMDATTPLLVYAGSVGPQYRLDAVARLVAEVRRLREDARLLVLTASPDAAAHDLGAAAGAATLMRASPDDVPRYLAAADLGLAYRTVSFSMQGVAPIKLSEYLLCGLPVVGTAAVGDTRHAVEQGVFLDEDTGVGAAARWFLHDVLPQRDVYRRRARQAGQACFSLQRSVETYVRALATLRS